MTKEERKALRKEKIAARDGLTEEERILRSKSVVSHLIQSPLYRDAKTVMIYKAVRGEVKLDELETAKESEGKRLVYPLCITGSEMIALLPHGDDSWKEGYCGILEPVRELSDEVAPEEIDLVICPCTVFDEECGRMGMGAGFYDRYLEKCVNAKVVSVAFEVQKTPKVPMEEWDKPMECVFTDQAVYGIMANCMI